MSMARLASAIARMRTAMLQGDAAGEQEQYERRETLTDRMQRDATQRALFSQQDRAREDAQEARQQELGLRLADMAQNRALQEAFRRDQLEQTGRLTQTQIDAQNERAREGRELQERLAGDAAQLRRDLANRGGGPQPKPVPNAVAQGYMGNQQQLHTIDATIAALEANPDAVGFKAYIPGAILNRAPGRGGAAGIDARAGVADVGSLEIRDRSGAAVTASEFPRLRPFIPMPTDDAATALKKLRRMRGIIEEESQAMSDFYTPEQGYRGLPPMKGGASKPTRPGDIP